MKMILIMTANLHANIMDFRGLDSSIIIHLRGGIPRPKGNFPESLSQAILVGIILVGRLGVSALFWFTKCYVLGGVATAGSLLLLSA